MGARLDERAKIAALTDYMTGLQAQLLEADAQYARLRGDREGLTGRRSALDGLATFRSWSEVDWEEAEGRAGAAEQERLRLVSGSSALAEVEQRLQENKASTDESQTAFQKLSGDVRVQEELLRRATEARTAEQHYPATVEASRRPQPAFRLTSSGSGSARACPTHPKPVRPPVSR